MEHFQIGLKIEFNEIELDENQAATLITQEIWEMGREERALINTNGKGKTDKLTKSGKRR